MENTWGMTHSTRWDTAETNTKGDWTMESTEGYKRQNSNNLDKWQNRKNTDSNRTRQYHKGYVMSGFMSMDAETLCFLCKVLSNHAMTHIYSVILTLNTHVWWECRLLSTETGWVQGQSMQASYQIYLLVAKAKKPHSIADTQPFHAQTHLHSTWETPGMPCLQIVALWWSVQRWHRFEAVWRRDNLTLGNMHCMNCKLFGQPISVRPNREAGEKCHCSCCHHLPQAAKTNE